jgi:hypothetical protein
LDGSDDDGAYSNRRKADEIDVTSQGSNNSDSSKVVPPHDTMIDVVGKGEEMKHLRSKFDRKPKVERPRSQPRQPQYHDVTESVKPKKKTLVTGSERPRRPKTRNESLGLNTSESDDDFTKVGDTKTSPTLPTSEHEEEIEVVDNPESEKSSVESVTHGMENLCNDTESETGDDVEAAEVVLV